MIIKIIQVDKLPWTQIFLEKTEIIPTYATNIIPLKKISHHTSYSILTLLLVACSACFAWKEFNAHWLRELGGSFLLVENTPNLLLLQVRLLGGKMGEKSTPADPPELCRIRLWFARPPDEGRRAASKGNPFWAALPSPQVEDERPESSRPIGGIGTCLCIHIILHV